MQQLPNYPPSTNNGVGSQPKNQPTRGNVAAVEPYNHVPHAQSITHNQNFQVNIYLIGRYLYIKPVFFLQNHNIKEQYFASESLV